MRWFNGLQRLPAARDLTRIALVYVGAAASGWIAAELNVPLPWMIGSILFTVAASLLFGRTKAPPITRPIGQVVIAGSVGLAFTPTAVATLGTMLWAMVAVALLTILAGLLVAAVLVRLSGTDAITASLSSVPMGPVESANLALGYGVAPAPVVFSQTIRILALILLIPPVMIALEPGITDPTAALREMPWTLPGAGLLVACSLVGFLIVRRLRLSNPFFLGSLGGAALAAALELPITAFPYPVLAGAQVLLGVWLGAVFDRAFFREAGRFVPAAIASTFLMILLCIFMGLAFVPLTGTRWTTMILATAPGSVTEMALTAKVLQEGIAVVTAFHVIRIFIILPLAPLIARIVARLTHWNRPAP